MSGEVFKGTITGRFDGASPQLSNVPKRASGKAFLVVICDPVTNAILKADVWSSPEWEQSMCLKERCFVAFMVEDCENFEKARKLLISVISSPISRYHQYFRYLSEEDRG